MLEKEISRPEVSYESSWCTLNTSGEGNSGLVASASEPQLKGSGDGVRTLGF